MSPGARVAAIDVGTNSTRLLVAEEHPDLFRTIERRMVITRLGQGVDRTRTLQPDALQRTLGVIADYAASCGELGVERLRVTGTSAVRDARNRNEFFEGVRKLTGHPPELLTGEDEARATFLGVRSDLVDGDPVLVVDIGGGSTELIYGQDAPESLISLDVGCVRMFEKHLSSDPPAPDELQSLRSDVGDQLVRARTQLGIPNVERLVGVAGTVTQLATLKAGLPAEDPSIVHHMSLSHGDVRRLARRLGTLPWEKRRRVKGLESGRVDVIVAGAEILQAVMETFDAPEVLVSEKDILDGLVIQLLES
ncbi:MAG: exopolyphosphatase / guanosine-5-triphosphate,3-diphosphate pyrophosphatase [Actinomycetota bacterium]|nr:exopolyphosphatase / guanosine-5-triphosphate,3-diphosphate pyrophosphatase [Actinomycetota bacterium]